MNDQNKVKSNATASTSNVNNSALSELDLSALCDESVLELLDEPFELNTSTLRHDYKYKGFDPSLGHTWIYPTNLPLRQYQFNISRAALFKNTLVVLPTGLGKTFIAAVVMYNIFRWYPNGKIIFMAPTRPLVAQQIEACYQIMGIPRNETAELTGKQNKKTRCLAWQAKRVFFVTPQVVWSDLNDPEINFPVNDIKLIVVDEAHKAKGKYAYTEVVQSIASRNKMFRILALSATPGRAIKDVIEVVENLLISHIEVRWENSIDVAPYTFKKNIKTIVVPLSKYLRTVRDKLIGIIDPYVRNLIENQVISGHTGNLSKGWLIVERNRFRDESANNRHSEHGNIMSDFSVCISLYHALELLERHGIRVLLNYFDDSSTSAEEKYFVSKDQEIKNFLTEIRENVGPNPFVDGDLSLHSNSSINGDFENVDFGHPKFEILRECLTKHFEENPDSKAIVFCEYRDSVFLIRRLLFESRPLIKSKVFVGQGASHSRRITQKEQIAIMNDFRKGVCNTLIATCVAEEGIDVGEVDLIVCFDVNNRNPTRYVQRIGRTGRKRQGKVIMLVTEGKEQNILKDIMATKDGTNQKITKSKEVNSALYKQPPRLVPPEFNPQCVETFIKIVDSSNSAEDERSNVKKGKKKNTSTTPKRASRKRVQPARTVKTADVRQFFPPIELNQEEQEIFDVPQYQNRSRENAETNQPCDHTERMDIESADRIDEAISAEERPDDAVTLDEKLKKIGERYKLAKARSNIKRMKTEEIIENSHVPAELKRFCLKNDHNFLETHCQEKKVSKYKRVIEQLLGGQKSVINLLNAKSPSWSSFSAERQNTIHRLLNYTIVDDFAPIINEMECKKDTTKTTNNQTLPNLETQEDVFMDPELNISVVVKNESKYESQLAPLFDISNKFVNVSSSTPKKVTSTPKMKRAKSFMDSPVKNSPIAKAFERSIQKMQKTANNINNSERYLQYLGLTSIDDLFSDNDDDDVCDTSEKVTETSKDSLVNTSLKPASTKSNTEENYVKGDGKAGNCPANDSEVFEEIDFDEIDVVPATQVPAENVKPFASKGKTQFAVTQLVKICKEDDKNTSKSEETRSNVTTSSSSYNLNASRTPKKPKQFNIGSISDLFQDNGDDEHSQLLEANIESHNDPATVTSVFKNVMSKNNTANKNQTKFGSDCTEEYDITELLRPFSPESSITDKKVCHFELSQLSDKENHSMYGQPVKKQRSADMFATFDEPAEASVNRTKSTPCNISERKNTSLDRKVMENPPTYLESFIENARTSPKIVSSPENSHSVNESKVKSPSMLNRSYTQHSQNVSSSRSLLPRFERSASSTTVKIGLTGASKASVHSKNEGSSDGESLSVFGKKPNLSRLQSRNKNETTCGISDDSSSPFLTCKGIANPIDKRPTASHETNEQHNIRNKLSIFEHNKHPVNSLLIEANSNAKDHCDSETPDEDEIFATCKLASPIKKPINRKRRNVRKHGRCAFIDDEAAVSGDESSDEDMGGFLTQIDASTCQDEGDPNIDMHAKYLQSVISPIRNPNFRIPPPGYRRAEISNIFSQVDRPEDSTILEDSFVVHSDDDIEEEDSELSELEMAELMLKERQKLKRKMRDAQDINENATTKRRRRIIQMGSDSDSD